MRQFVNKKTGSIILIDDENKEEIERYQHKEDYFEYFMYVGE